MKYTDIIDNVSKELGLPPEVVSKAYDTFWLYISQYIKNLPLKDNVSEEEFSKLRTNFNIPALGKLTCTYDRVLGVKKRCKIIKQIKEE